MSVFSLILVAALIFAVGIYRFHPLLTEAAPRESHTLLLVILLLSFVGVPSFYAVVSFASAEPAGSIRARGNDIPSDWTAGVSNHGSYYRWWTIGERPIFFVLSVLGLVVGAVPAQFFFLRKRLRQRKQRRDHQENSNVAPTDGQGGSGGAESSEKRETAIGETSTRAKVSHTRAYAFIVVGAFVIAMFVLPPSWSPVWVFAIVPGIAVVLLASYVVWCRVMKLDWPG